MKVITAVVRPEKLDAVTRAVAGAGACEMTVTEPRGFGRQYGHLVAIHLGDREVLILPKLRIDVVVQDEAAELMVEVIARSVNTSAVADGKIWVCPASDLTVVRVAAIVSRTDDGHHQHLISCAALTVLHPSIYGARGPGTPGRQPAQRSPV